MIGAGLLGEFKPGLFRSLKSSFAPDLPERLVSRPFQVKSSTHLGHWRSTVLMALSPGQQLWIQNQVAILAQVEVEGSMWA